MKLSLKHVLLIGAIGCMLGSQGRLVETAWPCGGDSYVVVDSRGEPLWLGSAELKRHGISMPNPIFPSSVRAVGKLTADVLIDTHGRVKCVRVDTGHPLLRHAIIDAVSTWTFRSFSAGGRAVSAFGHLDFDFGHERQK
jgi:hypothetical protein